MARVAKEQVSLIQSLSTSRNIDLCSVLIPSSPDRIWLQYFYLSIFYHGSTSACLVNRYRPEAISSNPLYTHHLKLRGWCTLHARTLPPNLSLLSPVCVLSVKHLQAHQEVLRSGFKETQSARFALRNANKHLASAQKVTFSSVVSILIAPAWPRQEHRHQSTFV